MLQDQIPTNSDNHNANPVEPELEPSADVRDFGRAARHNFKVRFEGGEHTFLGDRITLQFDGGAVAAAKHPLYRGSSYQGIGNQSDPKFRAKSFRYGQVLALGGDFYGDPLRPISTDNDPQAAFRWAYTTFQCEVSGVIEKILAILQREIDAVAAAIRAGKPPSSAYEALGDELSYAWNQATGGGYGILPQGRYLKLAAVNWDHFGFYARKAYVAGHTVAMQRAVSARNPSLTPDQRQHVLESAYSMNAFADHFLTDIFSAGHTRTPRRELYETSIWAKEITGLLARCMHDEDSKYGLKVHNALGQSWTAYGDKRLLDVAAKDELAITVQAVQASANDIWTAYKSGKVVGENAIEALKSLPDLMRVRDLNSRENFSPLFVWKDGTVQCRTSLVDRNCFQWTPYWAAPSTLAELKALGFLGFLDG
jgi:hypothetical protein